MATAPAAAPSATPVLRTPPGLTPTPSPRLRSQPRRRRSRTSSRNLPRGAGLPAAISITPATVVFAVFYLVPLGVLIGSSFTDWSGSDAGLVGLANYQAVFTDPVFAKAVSNTVFYCLASMVIQVPFGVVVGVLLAQRPPGWRLVRAVVFIPFVISGAAFALIFAAFYNPRYGLLNQLLGGAGLPADTDWLYDISTARWAIAGTFVFILGFTVVLVMAEIAAIPRELYEAAEVDGATFWRRHLWITLPLLRNVIGTCVLVRLLGDIGMFDLVFILTSGGPNDETVTLALYAYRAYLESAWGLANATGTVILLVGLILIVGVRRIFRIGERVL